MPKDIQQSTNQMQRFFYKKPVGVASHPDHIETIEKELKEIAHYEEQLEVISKHFTHKDPFKGQ